MMGIFSYFIMKIEYNILGNDCVLEIMDVAVPVIVVKSSEVERAAVRHS